MRGVVLEEAVRAADLLDLLAVFVRADVGHAGVLVLALVADDVGFKVKLVVAGAHLEALVSDERTLDSARFRR